MKSNLDLHRRVSLLAVNLGFVPINSHNHIQLPPRRGQRIASFRLRIVLPDTLLTLAAAGENFDLTSTGDSSLRLTNHTDPVLWESAPDPKHIGPSETSEHGSGRIDPRLRPALFSVASVETANNEPATVERKRNPERSEKMPLLGQTEHILSAGKTDSAVEHL